MYFLPSASFRFWYCLIKLAHDHIESLDESPGQSWRWQRTSIPLNFKIITYFRIAGSRSSVCGDTNAHHLSWEFGPFRQRLRSAKPRPEAARIRAEHLRSSQPLQPRFLTALIPRLHLTAGSIRERERTWPRLLIILTGQQARSRCPWAESSTWTLTLYPIPKCLKWATGSSSSQRWNTAEYELKGHKL